MHVAFACTADCFMTDFNWNMLWSLCCFLHRFVSLVLKIACWNTEGFVRSCSGVLVNIIFCVLQILTKMRTSSTWKFRLCVILLVAIFELCWIRGMWFEAVTHNSTLRTTESLPNYKLSLCLVLSFRPYLSSGLIFLTLLVWGIVGLGVFNASSRHNVNELTLPRAEQCHWPCGRNRSDSSAKWRWMLRSKCPRLKLLCTSDLVYSLWTMHDFLKLASDLLCLLAFVCVEG